ncbi:MAG: Uma2 family endonuclease [Phycisphaerae bacterium]
MGTRTLITSQEFETICNQLGPCELVRGEVVALSPGGFKHGRITVQVTMVIGRWAQQTRLGRVIAGDASVIVESDPDTVRGADVAYISYQRLPREAEPSGFCATPPELVVEVMGKGQGWREIVQKAGEYLRMGVDRVWVIDPQSQSIHILRPDAGPTALSKGQTLTDESILPGFSCLIDEFFAD